MHILPRMAHKSIPGSIVHVFPHFYQLNVIEHGHHGAMEMAEPQDQKHPEDGRASRSKASGEENGLSIRKMHFIVFVNNKLLLCLGHYTLRDLFATAASTLT